MKFPELPYYHIDKKLDAGGTACVYRAIDLRSGFVVAIKQLFQSRSANPYILKKFKAEANHYLYLSHPNLTKLVDFIDADGAYYIVMEFVEGYNLEKYVNTVTGPLSEERILNIYFQLLDTISYLHQKSILHLDIKPSNIMLKYNEQVKVLDMGISANLDQNDDIKKAGSPAFMSPEQIQGKKPDRKSDIYSLGITLFYLASGKLPFYCSTGHSDMFNMVLNDPVPDIRSIYPGVNVKFQEIIDKATQKDPEDRFQTCEEFELTIRQSFNYFE